MGWWLTRLSVRLCSNLHWVGKMLQSKVQSGNRWALEKSQLGSSRVPWVAGNALVCRRIRTRSSPHVTREQALHPPQGIMGGKWRSQMAEVRCQLPLRRESFLKHWVASQVCCEAYVSHLIFSLYSGQESGKTTVIYMSADFSCDAFFLTIYWGTSHWADRFICLHSPRVV